MVNEIIINRYDKNGIQLIDEVVVRELRVNLFVNEVFYISIMCMPSFFEEMAVGFLFSERVIKSYSDINKIYHTERGDIFVYTKRKVDISAKDSRVLISGCANGTVSTEFLNQRNLAQIKSEVTITKERIVDTIFKFSKQSQVFKDTGAVHSSSLVFDNDDNIFYEDIGRHNAVDKVIGTALIKSLNIQNGVLVISGRISSEIAIKTARLGIPILISQSAPTSMSVSIASKINMTLVGFARGTRFNVYSGGERIV